MPLNTDKLRKSPAVKYAIKEYRQSKAKSAKPETQKSAEKPVEVVRIEKKPLKTALEKIRKYFS
jgi:hypothetical protein